MQRISPLGALAAIVVLGVTVEVVEGQNKSAAYVLVFVLLLGMITFNASQFSQQVQTVIALLNSPSRPGTQPTSSTQVPRR
jgi:hypothetical protein